ncbi:MAG: methyltransferase domain-containing protein [Gammaproteobacteria bacterium]
MEPFNWITTHAAEIKPGGTVLDLACGGGRHTRYALDQGFRVMAVDINMTGIADLVGRPDLAVLEADLENGTWPLGNARFHGIIVTNYLHRPLFPHIISALAQDGVLIYETFMAGNQDFGRPSNPDFLLQPDELRDVCKRLDIVAFEQGFVDGDKPAMKQKIVAINRA